MFGDFEQRSRRPSKREANLELEHSRRIDVRERGKRVGRCANRDDLAECWIYRSGITVRRLRASQDVRGVEQVESFHAKQQCASASLDPALDEQADILGRGSAERGLAEHCAVD